MNHDDDEDVVEVSKVHTVCCLESEKFGGCGHRTTFTNSAMAGGRQKGQPFLPLDANPTVVDAQGNTLATWWHVRD